MRARRQKWKIQIGKRDHTKTHVENNCLQAKSVIKFLHNKIYLLIYLHRSIKSLYLPRAKTALLKYLLRCKIRVKETKCLTIPSSSPSEPGPVSCPSIS